MTELERFKARFSAEELENITDEAINECLETAKDVILSRLYPFKDDIDDSIAIPRKYRSLTIDIAVEVYNKRGAEGEVAHNENGISRTYENAGISESLITQIVPYGSVGGTD